MRIDILSETRSPNTTHAGSFGPIPAPASTPRASIIIVGGGASGALLATHVLGAFDDVEVTIVEPREQLGRGMAYATECPFHLLNVPAGRMSAFTDRPDDFVRWLQRDRSAAYDASMFVPRSMYGGYLNAIVEAARERAPQRLHHVRDVACGAYVDVTGIRVQLGSAQAVHGDVLVLALGNAAPAAWPSIPNDVLASRRFFGSAWDPQALVPSHAEETVLLLGTGLTAVDAVLGLRHNGHRGPVFMVSRRGLLPHEHRLFDTPPAAAPDARSVRDLIAAARSQESWRHAVDGVRSKTNGLWQTLSLVEQRRVFRHVMPYWNVHRHRMAPQAAGELSRLIGAGSLRMLAGRTETMQLAGDVVRVSVRLRATEEHVTIDAERVINCSGPEHDVRKLPNPLVKSLLASGHIAPYPLDVGLKVAPTGALIDAAGNVSQRLFAIGPVRFGTLIETTAIPEIREQARELAEELKRLSGAGGRGPRTAPGEPAQIPVAPGE